MPRRTKAEAETTRRKILESALDTFYQKGYTHSNLADIAQRIGLTKGAVYWHFRNKLDLFFSLAREMEEKGDQLLNNRIESLETLADLKRFLMAYGNLYVEEEALRKFYYVTAFRMEWTDELLPAREYFEKQETASIAFIADILERASEMGEIRDHVAIPEASAALYAMVDGLIQSSLFSGTMARLRPQLSTALDIFFRGMEKNPT